MFMLINVHVIVEVSVRGVSFGGVSFGGVLRSGTR